MPTVYVSFKLRTERPSVEPPSSGARSRKARGQTVSRGRREASCALAAGGAGVPHRPSLPGEITRRSRSVEPRRRARAA